MCYTYILYSSSLDKYYVGACHKDLDKRIENHNNVRYGTKSFTHHSKDWELVLSFYCDDYSHAIRLERKIKSMKSKVYVKNLLKHTELREKIFQQTKSI
jgi:putative endonuclease